MERGERGKKDHESNNHSTCAFAIWSRARRRSDPNRPLKTIGIKQRGEDEQEIEQARDIQWHVFGRAEGGNGVADQRLSASLFT